jgi:hypothetical protein
MNTRAVMRIRMLRLVCRGTRHGRIRKRSRAMEEEEEEKKKK